MSKKFVFGGSFTSFVFDADALAYFAATGITDTTQKLAINQLVVDLKAYGLWSIAVALYPALGVSALVDSYNLKDTSTYQGSFVGGWTHDANGVTGNGVNTYVNLGIIASTVQTITGGAFGVYNRTNNAGAYYDFQNGTSNEILALKFSDNNLYANAGAATYTPVFNPDPRGLWVVQWDGTNVDTYRNGSLFQNRVKAVASLQSTQYALSASFNPSNRNYAFYFVFSTFLTPTQNANFYTAVQTFQTALSRQVP